MFKKSKSEKDRSGKFPYFVVRYRLVIIDELWNFRTKELSFPGTKVPWLDHTLINISVALNDSAQLSERRCQGGTAYGTAGGRHGQLLMMLKHGNCPLLTSRSNDDDNDLCYTTDTARAGQNDRPHG